MTQKVAFESTHIEVACHAGHAYTAATPLLPNTNGFPHVPRYCVYCGPPPITSAIGNAGVDGGIFVASWRKTRIDDGSAPRTDPKPIRAKTQCG
jgi:hypothetical protein